MATIQLDININNGACNITKGDYERGEKIRIEISPSKLYGVKSTTLKASLIYYRFETKVATENFTQDGDKWVLETDLTADNGQAISCTIKYLGYERKYVEVKNNLSNIITDTPDGLYTLDEMTITLKASDGYEIKVPPLISYYTVDTSTLPQKVVYSDFEFTLNESNDYVYTFKPATRNEVYTVSGEAVMNSKISDKYGIITAYKPDNNILSRLSKARFMTPNVTSQDIMGTTVYFTNYDYIDIGKYIISLKRFYFEIDTSSNESITLGPYNTEIECPVIGSDVVVLDMGSIGIMGKHKNSMDYNNTDLVIYLPFVGFESLNTSDFMDKIVNVKYEVNVINGESVAIVYADGEPMVMYSCNTSFDVPYMMNGRNEINANISNNYMLSEKPFIQIKSYNKATPDESLPYNTTKFYSQFNKVHGYTQATEINFSVVNDFITSSEIDEIINALSSGVFLP